MVKLCRQDPMPRPRPSNLPRFPPLPPPLPRGQIDPGTDNRFDDLEMLGKLYFNHRSTLALLLLDVAKPHSASFVSFERPLG